MSGMRRGPGRTQVPEDSAIGEACLKVLARLSESGAVTLSEGGPEVRQENLDALDALVEAFGFEAEDAAAFSHGIAEGAVDSLGRRPHRKALPRLTVDEAWPTLTGLALQSFLTGVQAERDRRG